jgi:hypothetical protein
LLFSYCTEIVSLLFLQCTELGNLLFSHSTGFVSLLLLLNRFFFTLHRVRGVCSCQLYRDQEFFHCIEYARFLFSHCTRLGSLLFSYCMYFTFHVAIPYCIYDASSLAVDSLYNKIFLIRSLLYLTTHKKGGGVWCTEGLKIMFAVDTKKFAKTCFRPPPPPRPR